jgi:hypothetical protein
MMSLSATYQRILDIGGGEVLVAIDGGSGAGKSTVAAADLVNLTVLVDVPSAERHKRVVQPGCGWVGAFCYNERGVTCEQSQPPR